MRLQKQRSRIYNHGLERKNTITCNGNCQAHPKIKIRFRKEDYELQKNRLQDDFPLFENSEICMLVSVDAKSVLELSAGDRLEVFFKFDKKDSHVLNFVVESCELLVEGLKCSGIMHRALVTARQVI